MEAATDEGKAPPSSPSSKAVEPEAPPPPQRDVHGQTTAVKAESEEDEQMEKFYALLANIKAMREMFKNAAAGAAGGGARKLERPAEAPWTPAFKMEDFRDAAAAGHAPSKRARRGGVKREEEAEEEGEVVEGKRTRHCTEGV